LSWLASAVGSIAIPTVDDPPGFFDLENQFQNDRRATADVQLFEDVVNVILDGRRADVKIVRDLLVGETLADEQRNLLLTPRQRRRLN
jgi:hypothetical protein